MCLETETSSFRRLKNLAVFKTWAENVRTFQNSIVGGAILCIHLFLSSCQWQGRVSCEHLFGTRAHQELSGYSPWSLQATHPHLFMSLKTQTERVEGGGWSNPYYSAAPVFKLTATLAWIGSVCQAQIGLAEGAGSHAYRIWTHNRDFGEFWFLPLWFGADAPHPPHP